MAVAYTVWKWRLKHRAVRVSTAGSVEVGAAGDGVCVCVGGGGEGGGPGMYFSPQPLYGGGRGAAPQLVSQHCSALFCPRRWRLKHKAEMLSTALLGGPRELAGWPWPTRCGMGGGYYRLYTARLVAAAGGRNHTLALCCTADPCCTPPQRYRTGSRSLS